MDTVIETKRLILRPWEDRDAPALFKYAKDERVGPIAGWPVHTSIEHSLDAIHSVLSAPETYAVIPKETGEPAGSIGIMFGTDATLGNMKPCEAELGYWIGVPFWGRGLIPEAVEKLLERCFEILDCNTVYCGYYEGNDRSRRVQEKCGFRYYRTETEHIDMCGVKHVEIFNRITKDEWRIRRGLEMK